MKEEKRVIKENIDLQTIIEKAIGSGTSVEIIEKLLSIRRDIKTETAKEDFFSALSEFQSQCPQIEKTKEVLGKDGKIRYRYAPIEDIVNQVKHNLKKCGFSYMFKTVQDEKNITAICVVHHVSGHKEETTLRVPIDFSSYMNVAQKVASALTYAKRYSFCGAFGIQTADEDDDANCIEAKIINDEKPKKRIDEKLTQEIEIKKYIIPKNIDKTIDKKTEEDIKDVFCHDENIKYEDIVFANFSEETCKMYKATIKTIKEKYENGKSVYNQEEQNRAIKKLKEKINNIQDLRKYYFSIIDHVSKKKYKNKIEVKVPNTNIDENTKIANELDLF